MRSKYRGGGGEKEIREGSFWRREDRGRGIGKGEMVEV